MSQKKRSAKIISCLLVLCLSVAFTGCSSTKSGKNAFSWPSLPKVKTKESKPRQDAGGPLTVGEFIAGERPSMF